MQTLPLAPLLLAFLPVRRHVAPQFVGIDSFADVVATPVGVAFGNGSTGRA